MSTAILLATKDRVNPTNNPQLFAGISASTLSIILKSGHGTWLPQPYNGSATSGGSATTLNSTGVLAAIGSGSVGKFIRNVTDGSTAKITAVGTNSVTTTPLIGGTTNLWNNADAWRIDEFVLTLAKVDSTSNFTQTEQVLIIARASDTLTVATGGRGYNSSTANTFAADDFAYLLVTSPIVERLKDYIGDLVSKVYTNTTDIATAQTDITNFKTGAYDFVVTTGSLNAYAVATPALGAYAAGNYLEFKANFSNSGACTLNVNGLGAKSIKKNDGATALVSGDIISGQIVRVRYDGTNFQMISPPGTPFSITPNKTVYIPVEQMRVVSAGTALVNNVGSLGLRTAFAPFDPTAEETMMAQWALPDDYSGGTVSVKIGWWCSGGSANSVVWGVTMTTVNDGDGDIDSITEGTRVTVAQAASAAAGAHPHKTGAATVTIANSPNAGDMVQIEIARVPGDASDTYPSDANLVGIFITYA